MGNLLPLSADRGRETGFFAGCCNPAYIAFTAEGDLITSEKGNPLINTFERTGKHKELWLTARHLGGGNRPYEVKTRGEKLYVAGKNKIAIFQRTDIG